VPPGSDQERRTIIAGELADDWAELRQPMEFDFWEMEPSPAEKPSDAFNVSVLAASRLWITQLFRDCRRNGLNVWSIDGVPLAMARAVTLAGGATGGRRALAVDWGYSSVTLCVVGDDRPLYSRRIHDCAFGRVLDSIMRVFDVTLDEAQHLADGQGVLPPEAEPSAEDATRRSITEVAARPLEELVRQVRRTLQFTESQRRHLQPAAIWLLGGGAAMRNIGAYMEQQLGLPVQTWNVPHEEEAIACAAGNRAAMFSGALALSAAAWRAA
jgi:Tfp pilus assembly PilM family ATPase